MINSLQYILKNIEERPYIIGNQSVSNLTNFLDGYKFNYAVDELHLLESFQRFIEQKYFQKKDHVFS